MKPKDKKTAVGYVRVSTLGQEKEGEGATVQVNGINQYCVQNHLKLVRLYADTISGAVEGENRPQFSAMLTDIMEDGIDTVIVHRLDRIARSLPVQEKIIARLWAMGITVRSVCDPDIFTDRPIYELTRGMMGLVAQFDRRMIVKRLQDGRAAKAFKGGKGFGRFPFGYMAIKKKMVPNPDTAPVVKEIFAAAKEGRSAHWIMKDLNDRGIKTGLGKAWSRRGVLVILRNPIYTGKIRAGDKLIQGQHEPLVSMRLWNAVNHR